MDKNDHRRQPTIGTEKWMSLCKHEAVQLDGFVDVATLLGSKGMVSEVSG